MTRKVDKGHSSDYDKFDRRQKKHHKPKGDNHKKKFSIYDEFDGEDENFNLPDDELDDTEDEE